MPNSVSARARKAATAADVRKFDKALESLKKASSALDRKVEEEIKLCETVDDYQELVDRLPRIPPHLRGDPAPAISSKENSPMSPVPLIWFSVLVILLLFVLSVAYRDYRLWLAVLEAELHAAVGTAHAVFRNPSVRPSYTRPSVYHGHR